MCVSIMRTELCCVKLIKWLYFARNSAELLEIIEVVFDGSACFDL
jgi:hypothetical protein